MGLFDFLKKDINGQAKRTNRPTEMLFRFMPGSEVSWFSSDSSNLLVEGFLNNHIVFHCMDFIGQKVASCPPVISKIKNDKAYSKYKAMLTNPTPSSVKRAMDLRYKAFEEVSDAPMQKLIDNPNPLMTRHEFMYGSYIYKAGVGSSYWFNVRDGISDPTTGAIKAMYLPPAQKVRIVSGGWNKPISKFYLESAPDVFIDALNVAQTRNSLNVAYRTEMDAFYGLSQLYAIREILYKYNKGNELEASLYQSNGIRDFIFPKGATDWNDMSIEQISSASDALNNKINQNNGIIANTIELGTIRVGFSPTELGILESQNVTKKDIIGAFHIDQAITPWGDNATYNNVETGRKISLTDAVIPQLEAFKDTFNRDILPTYTKDKDYVLDFDLEYFPELQDDTEATAKWMTSARCFTTNEIRQALRYDSAPDENADKILVPSNVVSLEDVGLNSVVDNSPVFGGDEAL